MSELKLAISNIAWDKADDEAVYAAMQQNGFTGLEIAPTRIFPEYPYENLTGAALFGGYLLNRWGFHVPSMQSIWYGQTGNIFNPADAEHLLDYTAEAFQFAHSLNCPSLVFGCPKNRMRALGDSDAASEALAAAQNAADSASSTASTTESVISDATQTLQQKFNVKIFQLVLLIVAAAAIFMLILSCAMFANHHSKRKKEFEKKQRAARKAAARKRKAAKQRREREE